MEHATQLELDSLKKGARVEVNFNEPGFRGSWFTGTIIREVSKRTGKISIQFDTLFADKQHRRKKLMEEVDFICVRPVPPREAARSFKLDEDVDAAHNDGWWEGVVIAVHPPPPPEGPNATPASASYSVYFRATRKQIQFKESELRLHREWVHGEWVPPLENDAASLQRNDESETISNSDNES